MAVIVGEVIIADFHPLNAVFLTLERFGALLSEGWVLKTLAFAIMVGSVMALIERSGGVNGLVHELSVKRSWVKSKRGALMPSFIAGIVVFIESSITSLVAGAIGRPFCDRHGISRAKLAFVCDSTSAPVCSLIPLNGWGALLLGLIGGQITAGLIAGESATWLVQSIAFNFYAFMALIVTFIAIWYEIDIGPMRHAAIIPPEIECEDAKGDLGLFLWPMVWMIGGVIVLMLITGGGDIFKGSGSTSIFYTLLITLALMWGYYRFKNALTTTEFFASAMAGARTMTPIAMILLFAFAIGGVSSDMEVGQYLASFIGDYLPSAYLAGAIFVLAAIIAFATGTSWGTFSIMLPIAVPLAVGLDAPVALAMGAVISGGVFGDHCSPISDTTIISAMASGCSVQEHTRTQLPYALIAAVFSLILFIGFGIFLS
ncbi:MULTISPECIES: Na+/H+ antiporter NhaC family protein [unclassified Sulfuricurvum]|uniref:Na+/H+ antiporter NhaC family protein n=1 Tax=unclassified Sulfuricurvum TaxID=2632390 RepID=UPI000299984C|nr:MULTISPECIES: Na+/H+ antiporter NhaC family protein [unclassified Sulfuricurvum]AFV98398.1 transporter, nhac family protein [Candidatus Sulfuricurvum sp. RIFRC-1]HBM36586.1 sodium:proton antiporter [Sulfuricurvum sp.]